MQKLHQSLTLHKMINFQMLLALLVITQVVLGFGPPGGA